MRTCHDLFKAQRKDRGMTRLMLAMAAVVAISVQAPATPAPQADATCADMAAALQALQRHDARLRDWPELLRYREANRALPPPAAGQPRVVFIGDSITGFWVQPRFGSFFPGKPYIGRGIRGQTTAQMLVRFRADVIALKPKAVVILAGTNDIAANTGPTTDEDIQFNLASMTDLAKAHGIKVVLSSLTPTGAYHTAPGEVPQTTTRPMVRIRAINDWMKQYAAANGHVYLDYFAAMVDASGLMKTELTADDLHPNAAGYAIMAPLAQAAIDRALR
jgi:lysophospholipase L1-like esterase